MTRRRIYYSSAQRSEIRDRWQGGESLSSVQLRRKDQRAPLRLHEVEHVVATPFRQATQTAVHWLRSFGLYFG